MGSISKQKTKQKQKNPYRTVPFLDEIYTSQVQIHKNWEKLVKSGGYTNYFLMECVTWGLEPQPISKDFSHSKNKTKRNKTKTKKQNKQKKE